MSIISFTPQYLTSHSLSTEFSNDYLSLLALHRFSFLFSILYFFETGSPIVQGSLKLQSQGKLGGPELISSFQVLCLDVCTTIPCSQLILKILSN